VPRILRLGMGDNTPAQQTQERKNMMDTQIPQGDYDYMTA
jgi:hypothetical protein